MNKRFIAVTAVLCIFFQVARAQSSSSEDSLFTKRFVKSFRFPRDISQQCTSSFVSVVVRIGGGKVQGFDFSENTHQSLIEEFDKLKAVFEDTKWEQLYPAAGSKKAFSIYIPFVYYQSADCNEKISSEALGKLLEAAFDWETKMNGPVFLHKPIVYKISQPIP